MSLYFKITLILLISSSCLAQKGTWTWMHGDSTGYSLGNYGIKGISSPNNLPPARYEPNYWKDHDGNLWLFGGLSRDSLGFPYVLNDLWKFDVATNEWTWIHGARYDSNDIGVVGPIGVTNSAYYPPARSFGSSNWVDTNGNLWLTGGEAFAIIIDDMWKYDISINSWSRMKAVSATPSYGTQGVSSPTNTPGKITETKSNWVDKDGNFWVISKESECLWKYNPFINEWTWMKGNPTSTVGNYGILDVEDPNNQPFERLTYSNWKDTAGNFYIFGGSQLIVGYNDLWRFRPSTNNWTWIGGSQIFNDTGKMSLQCSPSVLDYPSSRMEHMTTTIKGCYEVFVCFGGGTATPNGLRRHNDLWVYDPYEKKWTFLNGNFNQKEKGNYGTKGLSSAFNKIPGKFGSAIWTDNNNNIWIFGGTKVSNNPLDTVDHQSNDLWKFEPDISCFTTINLGPPIPNLNDTSICLKDSITYSIQLHPNIKIFPNSGYYNDTNKIIFFPNHTTTYTLFSTDTNACTSSDTAYFTIYVESLPIIDIVTIKDSFNIDSTSSIILNSISQNTTDYEWYLNGNIVSQMDYYQLQNLDTGIYCFTLIGYNNLGCADTSIHCIYVFKTTPIPPIIEEKIYFPNSFSPNSDGKNDLFKALGNSVNNFNLEIFDRWGNIVFKTNSFHEGWNGTYKGEESEAGIYFYHSTYKTSLNNTNLIKGDIFLIR